MSSAPQLQHRRRAARRHFRPRAWSCVAVVLGCAAFGLLGMWQIHRGESKAAYIAQRQAERSAPAQALGTLSDAQLPAVPGVMRVRVKGHYQGDHQLLVDGRSNGTRAGYDVLTPMLMKDGSIIVVNRGWVPRRSETQEGTRQPLHVPDTPRTINGLWRAMPAPGLRLNAHNCRPQPWPRYVSYPTHADLVCLYGAKVRRGEVELSAKAADGFVRHWKLSVGFPPIRHYGYAAQWFMFGIIALYLFHRLNLRADPAAPMAGAAQGGGDSPQHPAPSEKK